MYAVIEAGGKQYRVELGSELTIDRLDVTAGDTIELGRVLLVADGDSASVGQPVVDGAKVTADVVRQDRGEKLVVFKYRPKARTRVKHGHRQDLTIVRIADIEFDGRSAAREARDEAQQREKEQAAAAEAAERQAAADRALADKLAREEAEAEAAKTPAESKTTARKSTAAKASAKASSSDSGSTKTSPAPKTSAKSSTSKSTTSDAKSKAPRSTRKGE